VSEYTLDHIDISALSQSRSYKSEGSNRSRTIGRIREEHGPRLIEEYRDAFDRALDARPPENDVLGAVSGVVLEVELAPNAGPANLSRTREKTRQGAVRIDDRGIQRIAFIVPDDKREILATLLDVYSYGELGKKGLPKNEKRVAEIEHIRSATFETFWRDDPEALPDSPDTTIWWGLWCFRDYVDKILTIARQLGVRIAEPDNFLQFPDSIVVPVYAPKLTIEILLFGTLGIAEVRRASDSPTFFTHIVRGEEQEWIEDLADRITWPPNDVPTVCLLDTGANRAHPLLEPALAEKDVDTVNRDWGADDHHGHGTGMAGLALHGDLTAALSDTGQRTLGHRAESVKILPPAPFDPNQPNAYGPITHSAVAISEYNNVGAGFRAFCMPVTNQSRSGAEASAWSAAIDQAAAAALPGDDENINDRSRRLFFLPTGNIPDDSVAAAIEDSDAFPAEDPSQAWNALAVGGYTDKTQITDPGYEEWRPWAQPGEISPYSRSSYLWLERKSPFKPDIVFEAGNRALSENGGEALAGLPSLSLLTTGSNVDQHPLDSFWATSAATALAARMSAQIASAHPQYWEETIRALMVHSAAWTEPMLEQLSATNRAGVRAELIRRFGYGVPSLKSALASAQNHLALVAQNYIQPFQLEKSSVRFREAHVYPLPWPIRALQELGDTMVKLKVTLSYFVEPNPSFSSAIDPARYQSFGLRFDLKRARETPATFLKRRNVDERATDEKVPPTEKDAGWLLGERRASVGSLHCDEWEGTAAALAARNMIWVYPVSGWWRERRALNRYDSVTRYALIMTLETADETIELHTPISALIEPLIGIEIQ
jgi:hypothetical protein